MSNQPLCDSCKEPMTMGTFEHQPLQPMSDDDPHQPLTVKFWFECWYCNTETSIEEDYYVVPKSEMEAKRDEFAAKEDTTFADMITAATIAEEEGQGDDE